MGNETVLFICSFNSVRSRIAESLLSARCGEQYDVFSAGIAPAPLNPNAAAVLREIGIPVSCRGPTSVTAFRDRKFDYVITLSDFALRSNIPLPKGTREYHHNFITPCEVREKREEVLADFRKLRDRIDAYLTELFPNPNLGENLPDSHDRGSPPARKRDGFTKEPEDRFGESMSKVTAEQSGPMTVCRKNREKDWQSG